MPESRVSALEKLPSNVLDRIFKLIQAPDDLLSAWFPDRGVMSYVWFLQETRPQARQALLPPLARVNRTLRRRLLSYKIPSKAVILTLSQALALPEDFIKWAKFVGPHFVSRIATLRLDYKSGWLFAWVGDGSLRRLKMVEAPAGGSLERLQLARRMLSCGIPSRVTGNIHTRFLELGDIDHDFKSIYSQAENIARSWLRSPDLLKKLGVQSLMELLSPMDDSISSLRAQETDCLLKRWEAKVHMDDIVELALRRYAVANIVGLIQERAKTCPLYWAEEVPRGWRTISDPEVIESLPLWAQSVLAKERLYVFEARMGGAPPDIDLAIRSRSINLRISQFQLQACQTALQAKLLEKESIEKRIVLLQPAQKLYVRSVQRQQSQPLQPGSNHLLALPAELRNRIFRMVLIAGEDVVLARPHRALGLATISPNLPYADRQNDQPTARTVVCPPLLRVNQQIRLEGLPVWLANSRFRVHMDETAALPPYFLKWFELVPTEFLGLMNIIITCSRTFAQGADALALWFITSGLSEKQVEWTKAGTDDPPQGLDVLQKEIEQFRAIRRMWQQAPEEVWGIGLDVWESNMAHVTSRRLSTNSTTVRRTY